jgi:hypothetical protein
MTRRVAATLFLLMFMLVAGAAQLRAHENFRIIGTLTKHQDSKIEVKIKSGKTVSIKLDKQTSISQDKTKVDPTALKAGQSVVVDAYGDTEDDSLAVEIRIVPPIRAGQR